MNDLSTRRLDKVSHHWRAALILFVVAALIASVVIPTRATNEMVQVVRRMNERVEPARLTSIRLELGLAAEQAQMEAVRITRDSLLRGRLIETRRLNDESLDRLERLTSSIDADLNADALSIRGLIGHWRVSAVGHGGGRADFSTQEVPDSIRHAINRLQLKLARENSAQLLAIGRAERVNYLSNVELVLAALAAMAAVIFLTVRERRLAVLVRRRAERESSLRQAAEALASAYTNASISDEVARTALAVISARAAFVVHIKGTTKGDRQVVTVARAGNCGAGVGAVGSLTDLEWEAIMTGPPKVIVVPAGFGLLDAATGGDSAIVIPLCNSVEPIGAAFVAVSDSARLRRDDLDWARTFQHIATLAYEKARLLDVESAARVQLESLVESRSRLMRGFSHDVKNPLGAADGFAALLATGVYGDLADNQLEGIERIRRAIHTALTLINDLHDFVRAEAGQVTVRLIATDLGELVRGMGAQYRASAAAKDLSFDIDVSDDLRPVQTDPARLRQVIANLVSNAIKYTDTGSVLLRAAPCNGVPPGGCAGVKIEVVDTGCGVPPGKQEFIFEEFSRLHGGTHPGAGLGLSISKLLTEALGGRIWVVNNEDVGATFTVWLPEQPHGGKEPCNIRTAHETTLCQAR
jgi:signal transduction histidine kinase